MKHMFDPCSQLRIMPYIAMSACLGPRVYRIILTIQVPLEFIRAHGASVIKDVAERHVVSASCSGVVRVLKA